MDPRVARTIEIMEQHLADRLTVPHLARTVELSATQLARLFRRDTGLSPGFYLHRLRLRRARILVERTSLSIAEIMMVVGIADRAHFARDFKRLYGFTPRTLRVQLRASSSLRMDYR